MRPLRSLRVAVFLAIRSVLRGTYGIAVMTTLMMALIYLNLLFLPSLIQGAINQINEQVIDTTTSNLTITPAGESRSIGDIESYLSNIRATEGVEKATATYRVGTQVSHGDETGAWTVEAIDPGSYRAVFTTPEHVIEGRYLRSDDTRDAFLGIDVAGADKTNLRGYSGSLKSVHDGDTVDITLTTGQTHTFKVAGVYENKFPLSDDRAFITRDAAATLLPAVRDQATTIYVRTTQDADVDAVIDRLKKLGRDVKFETSDVLAAAVKDQVDTFELINHILEIISLLVAAGTIFIITYVDLVNKRRQIGIERAIGIRSVAIVTSYVFKAWAYALIGVGIGVLLFLFAITPFVDRHPFQFPNGPVTLATDGDDLRRNIVVLLIVAMISALAPGIQSVRLRIVDAIWGT